MGFTIDGNTPSNITYNGETVNKVTYNGEVIWARAITVTFTCNTGTTTVNASKNFTMTTSAPSPTYPTGTYTYTLKVPYKKSVGGSFSKACTLHLYLRNSSGTNLIDFGSKTLSTTGSGGSTYTLTFTATSTTWLGDASSYVLYSPGAGGGNKDNYRWNGTATLTMTTP